jgi:hypothetical protein
VTDLDTQLATRVIGAIEVDRFAQAWLEDLGISGDNNSNAIDDEIKQLGRQLASATTVKKKGFVKVKQLAKNWKIGLEVAKKTIDATTQLVVQNFADSGGGKRIRPSAWVLNFGRLNCDVYCDTLDGEGKSLRGNKYCQIFATPFHFVRAFLMKTESDCHHALDEWLQQIGVPRVLILDNAAELTGGLFEKKAKKRFSVQCIQWRPVPHTRI